MIAFAPIIWEERYSNTSEDDKYNRWMRIGRINGMTFAIITKVKSKETTRYLLRFPNMTGDESLSSDLICETELEAKSRIIIIKNQYAHNLFIKE